MGNNTNLPFLFGAQYYRAPTPEPELWEGDLRRMRELGFNAVKFFVQWRWSHRTPDRYFFDDLDRLMELAGQNQLGVTLNLLLDVAPVWLYDTHPDARQIDNSGRIVQPYAVGHRQIGGHPGPCYSHPGARQRREEFVAATVDHFAGHPALSMWDVWNEPEQSFQQRTPNIETLVCYCPRCRDGFLTWLERKYGTIDRLNAVWGRCYAGWREVELPRTTGTITDFVDWREFHLDTMTGEARWRIALAKQRDPRHPCYLHIVPFWFNAVTCVDDFAMAEPCDLFAATMNGGPVMTAQVVSAARGKVCYNVESHLNHGCTGLHQPVVDDLALRRDFLPQIGAGIKGFLFWQFRAEVLGQESPAWGLVKLDGRDRPVTGAAQRFWATLKPQADALMQAIPTPARVGIWKSRKNEIFHFCILNTVQTLASNIEAYLQALYWRNIPFRLISDGMLAAGDLDGLDLLVMPCPYFVSEPEARALDAWVKRGGVLLNEAHLAGYNATTGRHSRGLPGCGLAQSWGLREEDSTSSFHLHLDKPETFAGSVPEDVRQALRQTGTAGGHFFPIRLADGSLGWGAQRYAVLAGDSLTIEGTFDGQQPCLASKPVGSGRVFYAGTHLGEAAGHGRQALDALLDRALQAAGIGPTLELRSELPGTVHLDVLIYDTGPRFAMMISSADRPQQVWLRAQNRWTGLFTGTHWTVDGATAVTVPAQFTDLFRLDG